jgi:two-component system nitrate/nitrite response regulator NarL
VVATPQPPTSAGVRLALEREGFVVSAEEATGPDAVAAAFRERPDLCLLDVDLPGGGIDAAASIRADLPDTAVVMLGATLNDHDLFASLEAGASGYLLEETSPASLGRVLHGVLRGEAALPRELTARVIAEFYARAHGPTLVRRSAQDLTSREWEVLDCLWEGLSTRGIAKRLFVTQTTVRRHVGSILRKLDVPTRDAAVEVAARRSRKRNAE